MPTIRHEAGPSLGRIDQYELLRELGSGGFGVVYLARDSVSGIEVALKTLHPLLKHNAEEMDLLREKFRLVSGLTHQNVAKALVLHRVRDLDVWDDEARQKLKLSPGDSVMVMDYAPGVTLSKWRRQFPDGVVPPDLALEIGRQIASALDYAHGERIVHRDVKPGNVMVETLENENLRVRILDFGLAAELRSSMSRISTEQGDTSGTRPYMAPEQWAGRKQDGRTDQYALACVLYELLSGAPPLSGVFETGDPTIMKAAVMDDLPEPVPGLPKTSNAALLRALAKDPAARFPSCTAFVEALAKGGDASRTRPLRRAGWLVAALLAVAGLGAVLLSPSDFPEHVDESHAETAESAENAEVASRAGTAETGPADNSHTGTAEGGASRPGEPSSSSFPSSTFPVLPSEDASLEELQTARSRFQHALDARRAEGWPDESADSAKLLADLGAADERIEAALAEREQAEGAAESARREQRLADARALADLARLRAAAVRDVEGVRNCRRWNDGEFRNQFALMDRRKNDLDGLSAASDLPEAKAAAADVHAAAVWIAENAAAREEIDRIDAEIAALVRQAEDVDASRYAAPALYRAKTEREDAVKRRDRSDFAGAKTKLESARAQYENVVAVAKAARAAAKAKEALVEAEEAKILKDWTAVLSAAGKALEWEPGNKEAAALKAEAEKNLKPVWAVSATLPGGAAAAGAKLVLGGQTYALPITLALETGKTYGPGEVTLEHDDKTYVGTLARTTADWKGERKAGVLLSERTGPKPGESIDLGGVMLEMVHCPGVAPDFWMGKFEVTQEQWKRVMGTDPSHFKGTKKPVECVSWNDCQDFIRKLNALPAAKASGLTFRLPTEVEWETACRAGAPKSQNYCIRDDGVQVTASTRSSVARYGKGWDDGTITVGSLRPNAWGLYDMHGNVWEWTETEDNIRYIICGGSFYYESCGVGARDGHWPQFTARNLGFRLAASGGAATVLAEPESTIRLSKGVRAASSVTASQSEPYKPGERTVVSAGGSEISLRWCPSGSFLMGSPNSENGHVSDETQHRVTLTKGFWMGETEVTQGLWKKVMGGSNPSDFKSGDEYPVENVSWNDCQDFLKALNRMSPVAGFEWRLPTEAQWEYACRAGTTTAYFWGNVLNGDKANCDGNYPCGTTTKGPCKQKATRVRSYAANAWGLYDMHGNVGEWCAGWYGPYPSGAVTDSPGPSSGSYRVSRGGSWLIDAGGCRSAARIFCDSGARDSFLGFRVALIPVP